MNKNVSNVEEIYPLTPLQEGIYYQSLLDSDSTNYMIQTTFLLRKKLDIRVVSSALNFITEKYPALRTAFVMVSKGIMKQVVLKNVTTQVSYKDISTSYDKKRLESILSSELDKGFDLKRGGLLRIIKVNFLDYQFLTFSFHHIILDGWSVQIIFRDFFDYCYSRNINIRREKNTFAEYVRWLGKKDSSKEHQYWNRLLKDYSGDSKIPELEYRILKNDKKIENQKFNLSINQTSRLVEFCKQYGFTISTFLETTWALTIQKYTNSTDVVFGKVFSGRDAPISGLNNAVGLFINTVPVRHILNDTENLRNVFLKVQKQNFESLQYSHSPLSEILRKSGLSSETCHSLFVFENYPIVDEKKNPFKVLDEFSREQTPFLISICFSLLDKLHIEVTYDTGTYSALEVELLLKKLEFVINQILEDINQTVDSIAFVTDFETKKLNVIQKNDSFLEQTSRGTIIDYFLQRVASSPNKMALCHEKRVFTYRELDLLSNDAAIQLRRNGVCKGDIVPVVSSESALSIVAILGILKIGGAYVPLDIHTPKERLQMILSKINPKAIFSEKDIGKSKKLGSMLRISFVENKNCINDCVLNEKDLAYIIYTSGTTGVPKGVEIEHRNILNLCNFIQNHIYPDKKDLNIALMAPKTFDASVQNLFTSLIYGYSLFIVPKEKRADPQELKRFFEKNRIDVCDGTPTHLKMLVNSNAKLDFLPKTLLIGGEVLPLDVVEKIWEGDKEAKIYNLYGPTEATVDTTYFLCKPSCKKMTIGKPISNVDVKILSSKGEEVGIGVKGEIVVSGAGVGRGYYKNKELTSKKFVSNSYKTGDFGRFLIDGSIEYLGRIDNQVKIRGYRIELSEIEIQCKKISDIDDCVVIAKENMMILYIVSRFKIDYIKLRESLRISLPQYMIPDYFLQISEIPLLTSGKINYQKLPQNVQRVNVECVFPKNRIEEEILETFREVLDVSVMGMNDYFFDYGGNSIKLVILQQKLKSKNFDISLKELRKFSSPSALCGYLSGNKISITENIFEEKDNSRIQITEIKKPVVYFKNCFYSAFFPAISYLGIDPVLFISQTYYFFELEEKVPSFKRITRREDEEILNHIGCNLIKEKVKKNELKDFLQKKVQERTPIIVPVDSYYEKNRSDTYRKIHANHYILITGYDIVADIFIGIEQSHIESLSYDIRSIPVEDVTDGFEGFQNFNETEAEVWEFPVNQRIVCNIRHEEIEEQYIMIDNQMFERLELSLHRLKEYFIFIQSLNKKDFVNNYYLDFLSVVSDIITARRALLLVFKEKNRHLLISTLLDKWEQIRNLIIKSFYEEDNQNSYDKVKRGVNDIFLIEKQYLEMFYKNGD